MRSQWDLGLCSPCDLTSPPCEKVDLFVLNKTFFEYFDLPTAAPDPFFGARRFFWHSCFFSLEIFKIDELFLTMTWNFPPSLCRRPERAKRVNSASPLNPISPRMGGGPEWPLPGDLAGQRDPSGGPPTRDQNSQKMFHLPQKNQLFHRGGEGELGRKMKKSRDLTEISSNSTLSFFLFFGYFLEIFRGKQLFTRPPPPCEVR